MNYQLVINFQTTQQIEEFIKFNSKSLELSGNILSTELSRVSRSINSSAVDLGNVGKSFDKIYQLIENLTQTMSNTRDLMIAFEELTTTNGQEEIGKELTGE